MLYSAEDSPSNVLGGISLAIVGIGVAGYCIHKKVIPAIKRKIEKDDEEIKKGQKQLSKRKRTYCA